MSDLVGKIARHPSRMERLALIAPDGRVLRWFAYDQTLAEIADRLRADGYTVDEDGTVRREVH